MGVAASALPDTQLNTVSTLLSCSGSGYANGASQLFDFTFSLRAPTIGAAHKEIFYENVTVRYNHTGSLPDSATNASIQFSLLTNNVIPFSWVLTPGLYFATGGSQPVLGSSNEGPSFGPVTLGEAGTTAQYALGDVGICWPGEDGEEVHLTCPHSFPPIPIGSTFITP